MAKPSENHADIYEKITARVLSALESGTVPWRKSWKSLDAHQSVHGHVYQGANALMTMLTAAERGYASNVWLTFQQARAMGGNVRKGEKGTPLILFKSGTKEREDGTESRFCFARGFTVFNLEQCDGIELPKRFSAPRPVVEPIAACEAIVEGFADRPEITHGGDEACYFPGRDAVRMPARDSFDSAAEYYGVLFHELTHATGHAKRCDRAPVNEGRATFGIHAYSKEELVAELGACFLCGEAGIDAATLDNSAAYLAGWLRALKDDRKLIVQAASAAQKAANWIRGRKAAEQQAA